MALEGQINFRIDKQLKQHFARLCKVERVSMAEAISAWMQACVRAGTVISIDEAYLTPKIGERLEQIEQRLNALEAIEKTKGEKDEIAKQRAKELQQQGYSLRQIEAALKEEGFRNSRENSHHRKTISLWLKPKLDLENSDTFE
ncbi:MAG: hypothetical protein WBA13_19615 [Microcoleaceae cyanobacterium]